MPELRTPIIEVFSSLQGEGPYAGTPQLFVRFQGCSLSCRFCDTPTSFINNATCRVEKKAFTGQFERMTNPLSVAELNGIVAGFHDVKTISVTGGEPLESYEFIRSWLPSLEGRYRILLETAGIHHAVLPSLLPYIDVISMDIKLPSVSGMQAYWAEHSRFLAQAGDTELYVKVVVSGDTDEGELDVAADLVADCSREIPFVIQPATPFAQFRSAPSGEQLNAWSKRVARRLNDVRIIPQLHKTLNIL